MNYAFIDAQNLYRAVRDAGWEIDYRKLRLWLKNKFSVDKAIMFFGYVKKNESLYTYLRSCGFELYFRDVEEDGGYMKGNVDIDITIAVLDALGEYKKAYLITSDGDFYTLVKRLAEKDKLGGVISPHEKTCSRFLKLASRGKISYIEKSKHKLIKEEE